MKKWFLTCVLVLVSICTFAQQYGYKGYDRRSGFTTVVGTYVCQNGIVTHKYSINGGPQQTQTYRCNPNVPGEDVLAVFDGIYYGKTVFSELRKVTYEEGLSNSQRYIKNAISNCENAAKYYRQGGCGQRATGFTNMKNDLQNPLRENDINEMIKFVQRIMNEYSHLNTSSTCGYVY